MMLDEVQTGNRHTGRFFVYQHTNIVPDVLTTAKGLGNGFPIRAVMTQGRGVALSLQEIMVLLIAVLHWFTCRLYQ